MYFKSIFVSWQTSVLKLLTRYCICFDWTNNFHVMKALDKSDMKQMCNPRYCIYIHSRLNKFHVSLCGRWTLGEGGGGGLNVCSRAAYPGRELSWLSSFVPGKCCDTCHTSWDHGQVQAAIPTMLVLLLHTARPCQWWNCVVGSQ